MDSGKNCETFYVMHLTDGEECVLYHAETYGAAAAKVSAEPEHIRRDLSIWGSKGRILGMVDPASGNLNRIISHADARIAFSGVLDWQWGSASSFDGLCTYVCKRATLGHDWNTDAGRDALIGEYLVSVGEDPADYGVTS
jgi:hypothetical protein